MWSKSAESVCDLIRKGCEKYSDGVMLWGGITSVGLIPRRAPIYFKKWLTKHCKSIRKEKATLDNVIYAHFIEHEVVPVCVRDLEHELSNYAWQDDTDTKHRTPHVLEKVLEFFPNRLIVEGEAAKLVDVWPIEHVWGIIKEKINGVDFKNVKELKARINKIWRSITAEDCEKYMTNIPNKLKAVIEIEGEQIFKNDYS